MFIEIAIITQKFTETLVRITHNCIILASHRTIYVCFSKEIN